MAEEAPEHRNSSLRHRRLNWPDPREKPGSEMSSSTATARLAGLVLSRSRQL